MNMLYLVGGGICIYLMSIALAYKAGRVNGKKTEQLSTAGDKIKLHEEYEKVDNAPDVDNPLDGLR